ncbi:MAG: NAD-dependent epimerase/dehydratase family protein [Dehalococcoidia bacterium]
MRMLITGGAGFQGSHLTRRLAHAGHEVTVLNTYSSPAEAAAACFPPGVKTVWGSVTDSEIVRKTMRGQDVVVHLAARINVDESRDDPGAYIAANVNGTFNVLEATRETGARMVFGSSCEVYGSGHGGLLTEASELRPYSPYAASKAAADRLCFAYHRTYGLDVTVVRPCNIYGEGQKAGKGGAVIAIFVERALNNEPLVVFGDGAQTREYMNVDDLVAGYELVLQRDGLAGETVNLGTGESVSIKTIAQLVAKRFNATVMTGPVRPGEVPSFELDSAKARALGFTPRVSFADGLDRYMSWRMQPAPVATSG